MKFLITLFILFSICCGMVLGFEGGVELTVYNQNFALVKEVGRFNLKEGLNETKLSDIASQIDPTSVHLRSLNAPEDVLVLEQNYEYDLASPDRIFSKYLGHHITIRTKGEAFLVGKLLSFDSSRIVLMCSDGKVVVVERAQVQQTSFPTLLEGPITRPTLLWLLNCRKAGEHWLEVAYITDGINWRADYLAVVDKNDTHLDISGWVTIDNKSGATYKDAKLKLVAGDVRRIKEELRYYDQRLVYAAREKPAPQFEEKPFFEYHLYTLSRPTTVRDKQTKQIELLSASAIPVDKLFIYDGARNYWNVRSENQSKKVDVVLEFVNSKDNNLGMALPAGRVRVYKRDSEGSLQFIGEDKIDHTPRDEKVRLTVGQAFDIRGERKQTDRQELAKNVWEEEYEITLRNHKDEDVVITVVEHLAPYANWRIIKKTHPYTKRDASTIEFTVPVKADGESTLNYRVRYTSF